MKHKKGKVVAVLAEEYSFLLLRKAQEVMNSHQADAVELRLDCLEPNYLNLQTVEKLVTGLPHYPLIVSVRNSESVPQKRRDREGFRSGKHDLDRIALLRKATEFGVQYFELEDNLRRNFFLGGFRTPQVIISHYDLAGTPSLEKLRSIYADVLRKGADYVKIETHVNTSEDSNNLLALLKESPSFKNYKPLTVVGRGELGRNVNIEGFMLGSPFIYGIVPSEMNIPLFKKKRTYHEMPTLDEVNRWIGKK